MKTIIRFLIILVVITGCTKTNSKIGYNIDKEFKNDMTQFRIPLDIAVTENYIYIIDLPEPKLRCFDKKTGNVLNGTGVSGSGPGDFVKPFDLEFINDTLYVYDFGLSRLNYFSETLEFLGSDQFEERYSGIEMSEKEKFFAVMCPDDRLIINSASDTLMLKQKNKSFNDVQEYVQFNQIRFDYKDDFLYVIFCASGELMKCNTEGSVLWKSEFDDARYSDPGENKVSNRGMLSNEKYYHFTVSDDYIYVLLGKDIKYLEKNSNIQSIIEVYSIDGKYIGNIDIDHEVKRLFVENDESLWLAGDDMLQKIIPELN